jgi:hypothetical protein
MADEVLLVPVPAVSKLRTDNCRFNLVYDLIDDTGTVVAKKLVTFRANDPALTANQQTQCVGFAKSAAQIKGLIS